MDQNDPPVEQIAEIYDPATGRWAEDPPHSNFPHGVGATATAIVGTPATCGTYCGMILVVGGQKSGGSGSCVSNCQDGRPEVYDPRNNTWTPADAGLSADHFQRSYHAAVQLPDGKVLVVGGYILGNGAGVPSPVSGYQPTATTEIFDPIAGAWRPGGLLRYNRTGMSATLLQSGKVLVAGGEGCPLANGFCENQEEQFTTTRALSTAELYDPSTSVSTLTGSMAAARAHQAATRLPSGRVLVAGSGGKAKAAEQTAEVYDPVTGSWLGTGNLNVGRDYPAQALVGCDAAGGRVVIAGGGETSALVSTAERYDGVPTVQSISPLSAPSGIATATITMRGIGLRGSTYQVLVGGVPARNVTVNSAADSVTAVIPPRALPGTVDVELLLDGVPADMCGPHAFTFVPPPPPHPGIDSFAPPCGPLGGTTSLHITGHDLGSSVDVSFFTPGGTTITHVTVTGSTGPVPGSNHVLVNTPPSATKGTTQVWVIPTSPRVPLNAGTFTVPCTANFGPTVTGITPHCGPTAGSPVTVTGQNFATNVTVDFDNNQVQGISDFSLASVTVTAPRHAPGKVAVTLINLGQPPALSPVLYEYSDHCDPLGQATEARTAALTLAGHGLGPGTGGPQLTGLPESQSQAQAQSQAQSQAQAQAQAQAQTQVQLQPATMMVREREQELALAHNGEPSTWLASARVERGPGELAPLLVLAGAMALSMPLALSRRRQRVLALARHSLDG